jgi:hypothetical protein
VSVHDDESRAARVEEYLREEMTGDDRAAFEREILRDPTLRAEVELAQRMNERLRAMYSPPAPAALANSAAPQTRVWVRAALGMAAVLAMIAGVYFSGVLSPRPGGTKADAVLARLERTGFEPAWACKDDAEFVQYTHDKFGQAFTVTAEPGVHVVGWDYCSGVLGDEAGVMMVKLNNNEHAIVLVDRTSHDRPVEVDAASGLHVHRRKVGDAVLYEVSKREFPAVLPLVKAAD